MSTPCTPIDEDRARRAASQVDAAAGLIGREIFVDEEIYRIELKRILD